MSGMVRYQRAGFVVLLCAGFASAAPRVQITGKFNHQTRQFDYQVLNRGSSPIVYIEFPHYHADALLAPDGWTEQSTNLVGAHVPREPGVCTARSEMLVDAIAPGKQMPFTIRLSQADADIGRGTVTVRFADGTEEQVSGVELPVVPRSLGFVTVLALAAAMALYGLTRYLRRKSARPAAAPAPREEVI